APADASPSDDASSSSDAAAPADASPSDALSADAAAALCAPVGLNAIAQKIFVDASAPAPSTYAGGSLTTGTYILQLVTEYGATYSGPIRVMYIFDTTAQTLRIVEDPGNGTTVYIGLTYTLPNNGNSIAGSVVCSTAPNQPSSMTWLYTATPVQNTTHLLLRAVGSTSVLSFTGP
ncbi:MAG TPA: hypothetical protein VGY54_03970, partial [Polyangiaceae bacterium]|nr:hypothetical protein [Polyangiaceae bacterium]